MTGRPTASFDRITSSMKMDAREKSPYWAPARPERLSARPRQPFVVAHELLHLRVPNHGRLFKALMTAHVPGWRSFDVVR